MSSKGKTQRVWTRLEDESRRTVMGFAFKLALVLPFVALARDTVNAIHTFALIYGLWCMILAMLLRQRGFGRNLDYWDEALWFFALGYAARAWMGGLVPASAQVSGVN